MTEPDETEPDEPAATTTEGALRVQPRDQGLEDFRHRDAAEAPGDLDQRRPVRPAARPRHRTTLQDDAECDYLLLTLTRAG